MPKPLRVVMVSASFHPTVGGAEKQALELAVALRARGVEARVLTRRAAALPASDEARGVPLLRLWCLEGLLNALTFMISLGIRLLRERGSYDVIHVHLAGSPALAAGLVGRLSGKPVIVKLGGGRGIGELAASARTQGGRLKLRLLSWLKPCLVAVAQDLAQECEAFLGQVPLVLPNGVDAQRYRPADAASKAALRRRLGWPQGLGFLYAGRLSPEKRLAQFLEAWAVAAGAGSFMAIVGQGSEEPRLRQAAERADIQERVFFHPPMEDIAQAFSAADVFVLPSVSEGLSNSLLEAMASGLAVLASRVGGTPEAVEEGRSGLLFDPRDEAELKRQITRFFSEPGLVPVLGEAARKKALEGFSIERIAELYEALYRREAGLPGAP